MGNRINPNRPDWKKSADDAPTLLAAIRATRDERNRIIRILEAHKVKLSTETMLAIMEGK